MADRAKPPLGGPGNLDSFLLSIKPSLDDVHFQKMKQALTKTGKGAPPKVDRGPLTHRLALQLELLRVETKTTWKDMESFFPRTVHGDPLEGLSLRTELEATVKEAAKVKQREGEGAGFTFSFSDFLCVDLGLSIMCRNDTILFKPVFCLSQSVLYVDH
ncbi:hypothetical protein V1264_004239 [Littorina saxatilis]|uniref:Uncharacterized protein n=1 Tax=Littorina saxatilis TaxID=31220 RepID=A0AAN9B200_9CAEN